jgi:hypothetical protein
VASRREVGERKSRPRFRVRWLNLKRGREGTAREKDRREAAGLLVVGELHV